MMFRSWECVSAEERLGKAGGLLEGWGSGKQSSTRGSCTLHWWQGWEVWELTAPVDPSGRMLKVSCFSTSSGPRWPWSLRSISSPGQRSLARDFKFSPDVFGICSSHAWGRHGIVHIPLYSDLWLCIWHLLNWTNSAEGQDRAYPQLHPSAYCIYILSK